MEEQQIIKIISQEMGLETDQVRRTVELLDGDNTIPFISRYRKEATGGLDEEVLRKLEERLKYLRNLINRKEEILRLIAEQDKLTEELEEKIKKATRMQELEDLYRPYRPRRRTRATMAREKGLEPLAQLLFAQEKDLEHPDREAEKYLDPEKELTEVEKVWSGARDIIAEWVADEPWSRAVTRKLSWEQGILSSRGETEDHSPYEMYYEYREAVKRMPPHRILAISRGEREEFLKVDLEVPQEEIIQTLEKGYIKEGDFFGREQLQSAIRDGYRRLLQPAVEREIRSEIWEKAEQHAITIFASNLKKLLLQPPVSGARVMGIDPGFRTGSKVVVVDQTGRVLASETIYPHPPQNRWELAFRLLLELVREYQIDVVAIGNGTACRETEKLAVEVIAESGKDLKYIVVDEAGASVYSASPLAKRELPGMDVAMRGAVSIARRLQDPLAELVKIDPKSLGVGMYQHDITASRLKEKLQQVVESCVNYVGVDLNTASPALLSYVSGLNSRVAGTLVDFREQEGVFQKRDELLAVKGLGQKTFQQAAGFLRIYSSADPLARTPIHPESYEVASQLLEKLGFVLSDLEDKGKIKEIRQKLQELDPNRMASELETGVPTLQDIIDSLGRPGRDPREDLPPPIFRTNVLSIEDLEEGMVLRGTVRNVVDFGAFVDIGVKEDGLVHISEMSSKYVRNPLEVVAVGDIVDVMVKSIDLTRKRIGLTMVLPREKNKGGG